LHGKEVLILDKARNSGGRLSTRRHPLFSFDHGAQFFTAKDTEFLQIVQSGLNNSEITTLTHPQKGKIYIGNPVFHPFISRLKEQFHVEQNALVTQINKSPDKLNEKWQISIEGRQIIHAKNLILTMPAQQTEALLPNYLHALKKTALQAEFLPCIAAMAGIEISASDVTLVNPENPELLPLLHESEVISWSIAKWSHNSAQDAAYLSVMIHANPQFSERYLEQDADISADKLWSEWLSSIPNSHNFNISALPTHISYLKGHRWRYAKVSKVVNESHPFVDPSHSIALAGDWLQGPRIESAWISGRNAALSLLS